MEQKPSIGRIVHYQLSELDAQTAMRRRTDSVSISKRISEGTWPLGAKAHVGNPVSPGDVLPLIIVRVFPDGGVNGRVVLDGSDSLWVTSVKEGTEPGQWSWPQRT